MFNVSTNSLTVVILIYIICMKTLQTTNRNDCIVEQNFFVISSTFGDKLLFCNIDCYFDSYIFVENVMQKTIHICQHWWPNARYLYSCLLSKPTKIYGTWHNDAPFFIVKSFYSLSESMNVIFHDGIRGWLLHEFFCSHYRNRSTLY